MSHRNRNRKLLISRAPTKAKSQEPAYSQALNQNKVDRQRSRSRESGRQTVRRLWGMVLRSAARLLGQIPKFGHVSSYMLEVLHWLPIRQRIEYRVASLVWRCQLGLALTYLIDLCRPVSGSRSSHSLRSSERGLLSVPFACTTIMQRYACSVVAPTVWNSLPPALHLLPRTLSDTFYNQLKTVLFDRAGVGSTSE